MTITRDATQQPKAAPRSSGGSVGFHEVKPTKLIDLVNQCFIGLSTQGFAIECIQGADGVWRCMAASIEPQPAPVAESQLA